MPNVSVNFIDMQQSLICILDILGTKGIWTEKSMDKYFEAIVETEELLKKAKEYFETTHKGIPVEIDFISFSDTLVITLIKKEKDEEKDPYLFHSSIEGFSQLILGIFQIYFSYSFFLRGAISFGEMEKRGNHFIGPAVDDAAEYFELPDMMGVSLTPKASIAMDYAIEWHEKYFQKNICNFLVKYKTPLKNKSELELYQIDWVKHFFEEAKKTGNISAEARLSSYFSERNIPFLATSKYTNSLKFFNEIGKNYR